jgi:hypothetical protein
MPNTAAQLVVHPLFWCGILFFRGGVGEDVLGNLFGPKDLFRKQVKTRKAGGATRDGAFLLSEVELIRFGSDVAYLDIS